jgi:A/G-specific adenine glycosylase
VLARTFNIEDDVKAGPGEKKMWALAQALLPLGHAADYNQAIMDLGATVCTPRAPACEQCPVNALCEARQLGVQLQRPLRPPRPPLPHKTFAVGVIRKRGRVLLMQRAEKLLGNLWAFPAAEGRDRRALKKKVGRDWRLEIEVQAPLQTLTHTFTHFTMTARVFECEWLSGKLLRGAGAKWVRPADLSDYPMGKVDRLIAKQLADE